MAHRGRLNVLANIMGKSPREIFREFADLDPELYLGRGDVKYHLGYSNDWRTASGRKVHLSLCFNPSHLEFVNPVALGRMRAKQDRAGDRERKRGMVILIHGDASFAGEGVVQETLNLSQLEGYTVGGTLHVDRQQPDRLYDVAVRMQVHVPTQPMWPRCCRSRSSTSTARIPKRWRRSCSSAMDFRRTFKRDVVIDMYCYRRLGHNEGDEPSFTQPVLYRAIKERKPVREGYLEHLLKLGEVTREEADGIAARRREHLEKELSEARNEEYVPRPQTLRGVWEGYHGGPEKRRRRSRDRSGSRTPLVVAPDPDSPSRRFSSASQDRTRDSPTARDGRRRTAAGLGGRPRRWLSRRLATEGVRVRLTGQDTARGTFSQRHAVLHDFENGQLYVPLQHLLPDQAPVEIYNSPLSEAGVLGFEYGYSLDCPDGLVLWEAQFGDFWNAAQVDRRPVHRQRRRQVAPVERPRAASATRLRRNGAGAFQRAAGTLPAAGRRGQHPDRLPDHAGPVFPLPAAPGVASLAEAAGRDDAQELAASSASGIDVSKNVRAELSSGSSRTRLASAASARSA